MKADLLPQQLITRVGRTDINAVDVRRGLFAACPGFLLCLTLLGVLGYGAFRAQEQAKSSELHLAEAQHKSHWLLSQRAPLTSDRERLQRIRTLLIDQHEDVRTTLAPIVHFGNVLPPHVRLTNITVYGKSITITDGEAMGYTDLEATRATLRKAGYRTTIATSIPPDSGIKQTMTWTGTATE